MSPAILLQSFRFFPGSRWLYMLCAAALLVACSTSPQRALGPGYHRVQQGETLSAIARRYGESVENLQRWNKLKNPNHIRVSQVLQVAAKPGMAPAAADAAVAPPAGKASVQPPAPQTRRTAAVPGNAPELAWPAAGKVGRMQNRPGVLITGPAGTPVLAAAPGQVAYVGSGLRGYGNLIILHHAAEFVTVYAHNQRLTVKEGERVGKGAKIAEMGSSDASQVGLYFEVRHRGDPVDPLRMLPKR